MLTVSTCRAPCDCCRHGLTLPCPLPFLQALQSLGGGVANKIDAMRRLKVALAVAEAGGDGDDAVINPNVRYTPLPGPWRSKDA